MFEIKKKGIYRSRNRMVFFGAAFAFLKHVIVKWHKKSKNLLRKKLQHFSKKTPHKA
jgi:hypothetical protein